MRMGLKESLLMRVQEKPSSRNKHANITNKKLDIRPPIKPSMVLLGLNFGRKEFLPKFFPIIYAPISKTAVLKITANRNILDSVTN